MFCFDSECLQYICTTHKKITFNEKAKRNYSESWLDSFNSMRRLLQYISHLEPHKIATTQSLLQAKEMIRSLTQPMADLSADIQKYNNKAARYEEKLCAAITDGKNSNAEEIKKLIEEFPEDLGDYVPLDASCTICESDTCKKASPNAGENMFEIRKGQFRYICYKGCDITEGAAAGNDDTRMKSCTTMFGRTWYGKIGGRIKYLFVDDNDKKCHVCECSWKTHSHVICKRTYDNPSTETEASNASMEETVNQDISSVMEMLISRSRKRSSSYIAQQMNLLNFSATFTLFLRDNALLSIDTDTFVEYVNAQLQKANESADESDKEIWKTLIDKYKTELKEIEKVDAGARKPLTVQKFYFLKDELFSMENFGPMLDGTLKHEISMRSQMWETCQMLFKFGAAITSRLRIFSSSKHSSV